MPPHIQAEPSTARRWPSPRRRAVLAATWVCGAICALLLGFFGSARMELERPRAGEVVGLRGLPVRVSLPGDGQVAASTLRVLLNGADVTQQLGPASNGAVGSLHGLLEGENVLRVEVFGRVPWLPFWAQELWVEQVREVRVFYRPPLDAHRG